MDPTRFDELARALSAQPTRRGVLRLLAGSALGALLGGAGANPAAAQTCALVGQSCAARACCAGARCTAAKKCVCKAGFTACRVTSAGGQQCFDLQTDRNHCGDCATRCDASTQTCSKGRCCPLAQPTFCVTNEATGAGVCVNTQTNRNHCGTCGNRCTTSVANATAVCRNSACGFACNPGFKRCNGGCIAADACCGGCVAPQTCGGGGTPGVCGGGCTTNCAGKCGGDDGCGGTCPDTCESPQTCGGGGTANVCGCTPDCTGRCGEFPNGCGGTCQTQSCGSGQTCQFGHCRTVGRRFVCNCGDGTTQAACQQAECTIPEFLAICGQVCDDRGGGGGDLGGNCAATCTI